jgi:lipopolysaccharide transport system ATP-binding protein
VAAHLEPEILLVDEVLAVGDAAFQKKCLNEMKDVAKTGRTVFFVSHNIAAVKNLCKRGIVLDKGIKICDSTPTEKAIREYLFLLSHGTGKQVVNNRELESTWVYVESVKLSNGNSVVTNEFFWSDQIEIKVDWVLKEKPKMLRMSIFVLNDNGINVFASKCFFNEYTPGRYRTKVIIPGRLLNAGLYNLDLRLDRPYIESLVRITPAIRFSVFEERIDGEIYYEKQTGVIKPDLRWITKLNTERLGSFLENSSD